MKYDISDFQREVIERSFTTPVLVDFWAEWCAPCRMLGPVLERMAEQSNGEWVLAKVNTEVMIDVAQYYRIQSIPHVKLFYEGSAIAEFTGALPEYAIKQWLDKHIPSGSQKGIEQAKLLITEGQIEKAQQLLDELYTSDPEEPETRLLLAKLCVFENPEKAGELIRDIEEPLLSELTNTLTTLIHLFESEKTADMLPDGPGKEMYAEAILQLHQKKFDTALERFIEVIRSDRYYDDDGSRKACIAIFKYLGEEHPTTLHYRKEFSRSLY